MSVVDRKVDQATTSNERWPFYPTVRSASCFTVVRRYSSITSLCFTQTIMPFTFPVPCPSFLLWQHKGRSKYVKHGILATVAQCLWTPCKPKRRPPTFRVGTSSHDFLNENKNVPCQHDISLLSRLRAWGVVPRQKPECAFSSGWMFGTISRIYECPYRSHSGDSER